MRDAPELVLMIEPITLGGGKTLMYGNLVATQFHPEKSGRHGLMIYANFIGYALGGIFTVFGVAAIHLLT